MALLLSEAQVSQVVSMYQNGVPTSEILLRTGHGHNSVWKYLRQAGVLTGNGRKPKRILPEDSILIVEYSKYGIYWISKKYGVSQTAVKQILRRLNVVDSSRTTIRTRPEGVESKIHRAEDFPSAIRREEYRSSGGKCRWCHLPVGTNWRHAVYHHKIPICKGGTAAQNNCECMHSECHSDPEIFKKLHGFEYRECAFNSLNRSVYVR